MSKVVARVLTGCTLALVVLGLILVDRRAPPGRVPWMGATLLALLCAWELARMGSFRTRRIGLALGLAAIAVSVQALRASMEESPPEFGGVEFASLYALSLAAVTVGLWVSGRASGDARFESLGLALLLAAWAIPPLFGLIPLALELGTRGLATLIVLSKVGDSAGYFVGKAIGKRHPFPRISPGKTVAGCVASLVAGLAAGSVLVPLWLPAGRGGVGLGLAVGAVTNLLAQAGDLAESWVKRHAGVKDSSGLLGPSGGVLDVVDSLLFTTPVAVLAWPWLFAGP